VNKRENELRHDLCEVGRRLYQAGFMPGSDGNLSTILGENEILVTPSRVCKGYLEPYQIIKIDRKGNKLEGDLPPTSEVAMHLAAYEERQDICAVAHCHPPILVAFTVAGLELPSMILPEIEVLFGGELPVSHYATPGGVALADSVREPVRRSNIVLLDHHGVLAAAGDIYQAGIKIEHAEAAARVIFYARQLGGERPLSAESVEVLRAAHKRASEMEARLFPPMCQVSFGGYQPASNPGGGTISDGELDAIVQKVVAQVMGERR